MKSYIKTALITSLVMLILTGGAGALLGKLYLDSKEAEKAKKTEEMDMNFFGSTKVELGNADVYELKLKGKKKNVETFSFKNEMKGIHCTCIGADTLDEAPFAYRGLEQIRKQIDETVEVTEVLKPVYNFKAGGKA